MAARKPDVRARTLERIRAQIERKGWPRVEMSLILTATGAAAFLFSFALLHLGLRQMWARYPLAVLFGYAVFLLGLKLWIELRRDDDHIVRSAAGDWLDLPDLGGGGGGGTDVPAPEFGGGGDFHGGGAGGNWGGDGQTAMAMHGGGQSGATHASVGGHGGS